MRNSRFELVPEEFLKQPDLAIYGLSILFVGMFLFLPFFNLLHPSPWHRWMGTIYCFGVLLATVVVDTPALALEVSALCKFTFCGGGILPAQRYGRARLAYLHEARIYKLGNARKVDSRKDVETRGTSHLYQGFQVTHN